MDKSLIFVKFSKKTQKFVEFYVFSLIFDYLHKSNMPNFRGFNKRPIKFRIDYTPFLVYNYRIKA